MTISFYLDNRSTSSNATAVVFVFVSRSTKERKKLSTGIKLLPKEWNEKQQRVRVTNKDFLDFNNRISEIENDIRRILLKNDITWNETVEAITEIVKGKKSGEFFSAFREFMEVKKQICSVGQMKKYMSTYRILEANYKNLAFGDITHKWGDGYVQQFIDKGYLNSTIAKHVATLSTFMRWSAKRGYHNNLLFQNEHIGPSRPEKLDVIALLADEVKMLEDAVLPPHHSRIRWMFLLSCYTGARYSDIISMRREDIKDNKWRFEVRKLRKQSKHVAIPFVGWPAGTLRCLEELGYHVQPITIQYVDRELKELCAAVGLNRKIRLTRFSGSTERVKEGPISQYVTFHCGRRTFISVLLNKGIPAAAVMALTGINNYKTLQKYLETYTEDIERVLSGG